MSETSAVQLQTEDKPQEFQEFPKWKYKGADKVLVNSKEEHDALGSGWDDKPNEDTDGGPVNQEVAALKAQLETLKRMNAELSSQIVDLQKGKKGRKNVADEPTDEPVVLPETGTPSL